MITHADEAVAPTTEHCFPFLLGRALAYRGRSLIALGQAKEGVELLRQGHAEMGATSGAVNNAMVLTWFAEAHAMLGQGAEQQNASPRLHDWWRPTKSGSVKRSCCIVSQAIS
jgi:hypothetical protein